MLSDKRYHKPPMFKQLDLSLDLEAGEFPRQFPPGDLPTVMTFPIHF